MNQIVKERGDAGDRHGKQDVGAKVCPGGKDLHACGGQVGRFCRFRQVGVQVFDGEAPLVGVLGEFDDFRVEVLNTFGGLFSIRRILF